jgi:transposase
VILAVATDEEGIPLHIEVLKGNRADSSTLQGLLRTLQRRFGIKEAVFSFDGGMSSKVNLAAIEAEKLQYVTRLGKKQLGKLLRDLPEDGQPELFDYTDIIEIAVGGTRYVIAGGEMRRHRDYERRETRLAKAEEMLSRMANAPRKKVDPQKLASQAGRALQRAKAHQYFDYHVDESGTLQWSLKEDVVSEEAWLDGWYLLQTNLVPEEAGGEEVLSHYKQLIEVEAAFRQMKSYLEVRPVYHHKPDRVRNHMRLCFLAYWISARLSTEWQARGETRRVPVLLQALQKIRVGVLKVGKDLKVHRLSIIPPALNQTLEKLGLLHLFSKTPRWAEM